MGQYTQAKLDGLYNNKLKEKELTLIELIESLPEPK